MTTQNTDISKVILEKAMKQVEKQKRLVAGDSQTQMESDLLERQAYLHACAYWANTAVAAGQVMLSTMWEMEREKMYVDAGEGCLSDWVRVNESLFSRNPAYALDVAYIVERVLIYVYMGDAMLDGKEVTVDDLIATPAFVSRIKASSYWFEKQVESGQTDNCLALLSASISGTQKEVNAIRNQQKGEALNMTLTGSKYTRSDGMTEVVMLINAQELAYLEKLMRSTLVLTSKKDAEV